jgi:uncharacterized protein
MYTVYSIRSIIFSMKNLILIIVASSIAISACTPEPEKTQAKVETKMNLYDAAVFGNFSEVQKQLEADPRLVNSTDKYGFTPLHGVAGEDQYKMLEYLITKGANVNAQNEDGIAPLHLASYPHVVQILVSAGANLNIRDKSGNTPLHVITEHQDDTSDVIQALVQAGADINAQNSDSDTPLDIALSREDEEKIEVIKFLGGKASSDL